MGSVGQVGWPPPTTYFSGLRQEVVLVGGGGTKCDRLTVKQSNRVRVNRPTPIGAVQLWQPCQLACMQRSERISKQTKVSLARFVYLDVSSVSKKILGKKHKGSTKACETETWVTAVGGNQIYVNIFSQKKHCWKHILFHKYHLAQKCREWDPIQRALLPSACIPTCIWWG